jgi:Ca2+-binding RTX toxin-like protein
MGVRRKLFIATPAVDMFNGGRGFDTVSYQLATTGVTVDLVRSSLNTGDAAGDRFRSIEGLIGSSFDDALFGNHKRNVIDGRDGNDRLYGFGGDDSLFGGAGDDVLEGGMGKDRLYGGDGFDTASYLGAFRGVTVNLGKPSLNRGEAKGDRFYSIEAVVGSRYGDSLIGDENNNVLNGAEGDDYIFGGGGNDVLIGGPGRDTLDGGTGFDLVSYETSHDGVTVNLADATQNSGDAAHDQLLDIEGVQGSAYADRLTGDANSNTLLGGGGDDLLVGGGGADHLDGGEGFDTASYEGSSGPVTVNMGDGSLGGGDAAGDTFHSIENIIGSTYGDSLIGDNNRNVLNGIGGDDFLFGLGDDDVLIGGEGADHLDGGEGIDLASYENAHERVVVNLSNPSVNEGDAAGDSYYSIEGLVGGSGNDDLTGDDNANLIFGGEGDDYLYGGGGNDLLDGGDGHDRLEAGTGADSLFGGLGSDTFAFHKANFTPGLRDVIVDFQTSAASDNDTILLEGLVWSDVTYTDLGADALMTIKLGGGAYAEILVQNTDAATLFHQVAFV